jgi:hypothetical protein
MAKVNKGPGSESETALVKDPKPDHTEKIRSQVLAKIGKLPRLERVEVCKQHNGKYRVNIWEKPEPTKELAVSASLRIVLSYYLTVSPTGEIVNSNPPMTNQGSPG